MVSIWSIMPAASPAYSSPVRTCTTTRSLTDSSRLERSVSRSKPSSALTPTMVMSSDAGSRTSAAADWDTASPGSIWKGS